MPLVRNAVATSGDAWQYVEIDGRRYSYVAGVVPPTLAADGVTALNRPPSLVRDFTWTLMNRAPHSVNANDETGNNLDLLQIVISVAVDPEGRRLAASDAAVLVVDRDGGSD